MHRISRTILFTLFLTFFLVAAPAIVLYTAGYRYNTKNGHIVRTGVLAVSSMPRGASILLDGKDTGKTTPYVFSRIMPGAYAVTLAKDGYHAFEDAVVVESGKSSYVSDIALFAASAPMLLTAETDARILPSVDGDTALVLRSAEAWEYDVGSGEYALVSSGYPDGWSDNLVRNYPLRDSTPTATQIIDNFLLVNTASSTEVRHADAPESIVALLPKSDYLVSHIDGTTAVLTAASGQRYLIDIAAAQPILLSTRATAFDWKPDAGMFVWTDGFEINAYATANNVSAFITRQSTPVDDVALDVNGATVFVASAATVASYTVTETDTHTTTLANMDAIEQCWTLEGESGTLYVVGTLDGVRGIYELALR